MEAVETAAAALAMEMEAAEMAVVALGMAAAGMAEAAQAMAAVWVVVEATATTHSPAQAQMSHTAQPL